MKKPVILQIAVPVPIYSVFDYRFEGETEHVPAIGHRVVVPFGRKTLVGIVVALLEQTQVLSSKLKAVKEVCDANPVISAEMFQLLEWAAAYYHYPLGEVMSHALPKRLRQGESMELKQEKVWTLSSEGESVSVDTLKRAPKQAAILQFMQQAEQRLWCADELGNHWDNWRATVKSLCEKGLIEQTSRDVSELQTASTGQHREPISLNPQQSEAAQKISQALLQYQCFLLQGVTGSGKTEVYLQVIQQALAEGLQVLVLVPEISLTPQLTRRFSQRLDVPIASLHSGLNDRQRQSAWINASRGVARVVIGTRSALFTPMPELGLIILDEEHDGSFKQQEGFRYHARDLALVRAKNRGIPVVLGSATPSLESIENARRGQYQLLELTQRGVSGAKPPKVSLLDVCRRPMENGISDLLLKKVHEHIEKQGQVLLFLNRRGYAPLLMCHDCGWSSDCPRCDANMTLHHHKQRLCCHHCGYEKPAPKVCPQCHNESLYIPGAGTERIELALKDIFPDILISRIDRDTTRRKGELNNKLEQARTGEAQILIGTQMLAKGHDFPNLTLVGMLDVDQGLFSADFRGAEHMAQLIIQVAGRAGRAQKQGEVVIQTHQPEHPLLHVLLEQGYRGFASAAVEERRQAHFPPYSFMAILRCESPQQPHGEQFLRDARLSLDQSNIEAFGPLPAPMEKRAGRYRWQLILLASERKYLHGACKIWVPELSKLKSASRVRWSIDIDPQDMF